MEPQLFNLKFQLFDIDCEIRNVDPDEFSYIVLIKDMKKCVTKENEVVQLYLDEKFRVEARLSLSRKKRLIDNEEDVAFLFEQYGSKRLKDIRLNLEEYSEDDFHWSDASYDDESSNEFAGIVRNVDGEVDDNDGGNGGEEGVETSDNGEKERVETGDDKGEEGAEIGEHLFDYQKYNDDFIRGLHFTGIDECHLKGHYGGVLLSVVSMDANNGIFLLAICVCEAKNNGSWGFFFRLSYNILGDLEHYTFMSDRQQNILNAIEAEWLNARSQLCTCHVYANFKKHFPKVHTRKFFWAVSRVTNKPNFVKAMGSVKDVDVKCGLR
ncbi:hypothetical protein Pint_18451 [Pistacia integerrima]|uniref:Uncharacterized protein n=1 Tax=Pistacia integerrima TaxID=434235 RepID=A0ACC0YXM0_9ROSI|nr:hypothetical protein Pint_18451 [Pistacia integerrima]